MNPSAFEVTSLFQKSAADKGQQGVDIAELRHPNLALEAQRASNPKPIKEKENQ
jgi:hypothetical protein